jgi:hypothetical protein
LQKSQSEGAGHKAAVEQLSHQVKSQENELERLHAAAQSAREEAQRQLDKVEDASKKDRAERDAAIKEAAELRGLSEGLKAQNAELISRFSGNEK